MEFVKKLSTGLVLVNLVYGFTSLIQLNSFLPLLPLEDVFIAILAIFSWFYAKNKIKHILILVFVACLLTSQFVYSSFLSFDQVQSFENTFVDILIVLKFLSIGLFFFTFLRLVLRRVIVVILLMFPFIGLIISSVFSLPITYMSCVVLVVTLIHLLTNKKQSLLDTEFVPFIVGTSCIHLTNQFSFWVS